MSLKLLKQPQFLIGSFIMGAMILISFTLHHFYSAPEQVPYLYKDGELVGVAPFTPSQVPPFGTDRFGRNLLFLLFDGAKYTILIAFGIAIIRVAVSGIFSIFYNHYSKKLRPVFEDIFESTLFVPTSILAYILIAPLVFQQVDSGKSFTEILVIQCIILVLIGVPPLVSTLSKDMSSIMKKEYISSTFTLGAKPGYVYRRHVLPEMASRFLLVVAQQIISVLLLLAHLGVLLVFLGGGQTFTTGDIFNVSDVLVSMSGEWSGLIGSNYKEVMLKPHIVLIPLGFFGLTIFAMNLVINGIQNSIKSERS
ncbi:ABC transporter permease subunit [Alkalihalobacillus sp. AL-G]|uniref:ABC transporter permease subunit n=1 Tax=Alkalihalobacillus sp. AL-G TaxID=2926399 RepID=UPI00272BCA6B|nr:ABC transporter permease subunit [Alkalihalobacillus sp. AL-G]WLD92591.1 ABC transporter permease subunit [Alkalihalobacillus sp. AL-G]